MLFGKSIDLILPAIKKVRGLLATSIFLVIVSMLLTLSVPLILKYCIDLLSQAPEVHISTFVLLSYGIVWTMSSLVNQFRSAWITYALEEIAGLWSLRLFDHILGLSLRFHLEKKLGFVSSMVTRADEALSSIFYAVFLFLIPTILELVCAVGILMWLYGPFYALIIGLVLIVYGGLNWFGFKYLRRLRDGYNEKRNRVSALFIDSLTNIETTKYFASRLYEYKQSQEALRERKSAAYAMQLSTLFVEIGQLLTVGIVLITSMYCAGKAVADGILQIGDYVLISSYVLHFVMPLQYAGLVLNQLNKGISDLSDSCKILALKPEIHDEEGAQELVAKSVALDFEQVSFQYQENRSLLNDITFSVPAGTTVALVGATGAGKSTIMRLLFRLYDVTKGVIKINGCDIRMITQESLHKILGIVPQETVLFNRSLSYNIAYGAPDASQEAIERAAYLACLEPFISTLPDGYATIVGERGLKLSGGEKQRIAVARALLKKPLLYIFDEATSALDSHTEKLLQKNIQASSGSATVLIITHRLMSIVDVDEILVFHNGQIVERGTHAELLSKSGRYAHLWEQQKESVDTTVKMQHKKGDHKEV